MLLLLAVLGCLPSQLLDDTGDTVVDPGDGGAAGSSLADIDPAMLPQVDGACRQPELATVDYVVDGDTIYVTTSQGSEKIRFIGVNTPEMGFGDSEQECYGPEALAFTADRLSGGEVWLTFDKDCLDPYDRTLAYLFLGTQDEDFLQRALLRGGFAEVMIYDPNDAFEDIFRDDEADAQHNSAGQWGACGG